jgi:hypothetical protein
MLRVSSAAVVPASAIKLIQKKVNVLVAAHVHCRDEVTDGANQQTGITAAKDKRMTRDHARSLSELTTASLCIRCSACSFATMTKPSSKEMSTKCAAKKRSLDIVGNWGG